MTKRLGIHNSGGPCQRQLDVVLVQWLKGCLLHPRELGRPLWMPQSNNSASNQCRVVLLRFHSKNERVGLRRLRWSDVPQLTVWRSHNGMGQELHMIQVAAEIEVQPPSDRRV